MRPILCKHIISVLFSHMKYTLCEHCTTPSTLEQCPSGWSLYQERGHQLGACQKCRFLGPTQAHCISKRNWSILQMIQIPALRQWLEGQGKCVCQNHRGTCWKYTCKGSAPGGPGGPDGKGRGLCILKKLPGDLEATSLQNITSNISRTIGRNVKLCTCWYVAVINFL